MKLILWLTTISSTYNFDYAFPNSAHLFLLRDSSPFAPLPFVELTATLNPVYTRNIKVEDQNALCVGDTLQDFPWMFKTTDRTESSLLLCFSYIIDKI